ncbi:hypothetical protein FHS39_004599, partial [Streptomyces olivoverticillatus]|nr:hypothetical protein [Streptomyces olivoverticillatus]
AGRSFSGWHRHVTLASAAHAVAALSTRHDNTQHAGTRHDNTRHENDRRLGYVS